MCRKVSEHQIGKMLSMDKYSPNIRCDSLDEDYTWCPVINVEGEGSTVIFVIIVMIVIIMIFIGMIFIVMIVILIKSPMPLSPKHMS